MSRHRATLLVLAAALLGFTPAPVLAQAVVAEKPAQAIPVDEAAAIDKIFERWDRTGSPGCAVGVARGGQVVHSKGYGMANLEYGIRIWPSTVFESGSVAKQFTAAAINLLAQDGKLSLDDPVRKYIPELPDFGTPILIRHLLNHTSGLRSQWPMLALAGRPPGMAVHTVAEILELVSHYKELNFKPGDEFLYNNTGFTLLGVVVQRVSGKSLNQFSQERLFGPLGMTRTQWREDFSAIVPNRATAYRPAPDGGFRANMPFTNVVGNGGLLTTVGDLLTWNENLDRPRVGGQDARPTGCRRRGRLNDGFENEYAQGLIVTSYRGVREVSHGGSTAGYQTFLARFPDHGLSVAVLCNTSGTNPSRYAHDIADIVLAGKLKDLPVVKAVAAPPEVPAALAGVYREPETDAVLRLDWDAKANASAGRRTAAGADGAGEFYTQDGARGITTGRGWPEDGVLGALVEASDGRSRGGGSRSGRSRPNAAQLAEFAGDYTSDELGVTYTVYVEAGRLEGALQARGAVHAGAGVQGRLRRRRQHVPVHAIAGRRRRRLLIYAGRARHVRFVRQ